MPLSDKQLSLLMPHLPSHLRRAYLPFLNEAIDEFQIDSRLRICAFVANLAVESGELRYWEEIASGRAYDTGRKAVTLGNTPQRDGDGEFFKGHGPIQITGFTNHRNCGKYLKLDLLKNPRLLCQKEYGFRAAGWFWTTEKNLNVLADCLTGTWNENEAKVFRAIVRAINGGYNHYAERVRYYKRALTLLPDELTITPPPPTTAHPVSSSPAALSANLPPTPGQSSGQNTDQRVKAAAVIDQQVIENQVSIPPTVLAKAGRTLFGRISGRVLSFGTWAWAAVEAGNISVIATIIVLLVGGAIAVYYYRNEITIHLHRLWCYAKGHANEVITHFGNQA